jgi:hypothetical protein
MLSSPYSRLCPRGGSEASRFLARSITNLYLLVVPITLVPLKGKAFKIEPAGTEKVGDKPTVVRIPPDSL